MSESEVAAAIAAVLAGREVAGLSQEEAVAELLMKLPDPPEPEAAIEAARLVLANG